MAQMQVSADKIFQINKFIGVNENPDGDTKLKMSEMSEMTNFKVTNDGSLQIRPGTQDIANLALTSNITTSTTATTVKSDVGSPTSTFTAYPGIGISTGGVLTLSGTPVTVMSSNITGYTNYYYQDDLGAIYKIGTCTFTAAEGTRVQGGSIILGTTVYIPRVGGTITSYPSVEIVDGAVVGYGTSSTVTQSSLIGRYADLMPPYCLFYVTAYELVEIPRVISGYPVMVPTDVYTCNPVGYAGEDAYNWDFYLTTITTNPTDIQVKCLWSGIVNSSSHIMAACNGKLWSLTESNGVWTKTNVGSITTTGKVNMFGFNNYLYIQDGEYKRWDGATLLTVPGYVPLVATGVLYSGGGTQRQRVNMLNGKRRIWISPDGTHSTFQLPEVALSSIDYHTLVATGVSVSISSTDLTNGTITFSSAPAAGVNTIEIGYTVSSTISNPLRAKVTAMTLAETFNGTQDSRVFIYGNGTNKAYYSDLDYNGIATAEYFPDLNEMQVGFSDAQLTSMIRHYDRLLAFKPNSAFSIRYDTITLASGDVTAGFYCTPVSKEIGSIGPAQVVDNHPRTLDGRSIYEWVATTSSGNITSDQRNANRISQKVETTLRELDFTKAYTFYDKINHEYYVVENGIAIVQNTAISRTSSNPYGVWYIYRDFPATSMVVYEDDLYFGTATGYVKRVSRDYFHDSGTEITAFCKSGDMDFDAEMRLKNSPQMWVSLLDETDSSIKVSVETEGVETEAITLVPNIKEVKRCRIKAKDFARYKLIFRSVPFKTATILGADIQVSYAGNIK
jgi:hypothetical protein